MLFGKLFARKDADAEVTDANELLAAMSEDEVRRKGMMLFWKHDGNLAATVAEPDEAGHIEVDMSVLAWQFGRKQQLSDEEEQLFVRAVTASLTASGCAFSFSEPVDFFERRRLSDRI